MYVCACLFHDFFFLGFLPFVLIYTNDIFHISNERILHSTKPIFYILFYFYFNY